MSTEHLAARTSHDTHAGLSAKGLKAGSVGLIGAVVIGVSCIAPAYTLTAALGPTVAEVGVQLPAIFLVGFIPMLLVAFGYRELNNAMPDAGTSFTWASRAFGPWIGWMGGWGLIAATIIVLSNLAAVAVDFFYLMLAQLFGNPELADLTLNLPVNIATTLVFIALACWISYRGMETTKGVQYVLVAFQLFVLGWFAVAAFGHVANGTAFDATAITPEWFNPFAVESFSAFAAGVSLSIFIYWGWDVTLTMNEETRNPEKT
ncbi:MAG TPA: APC family permease, partial [Arthrobacter sp.]|nr:APC family permease [Arthrobacter sp.]